MNLPTLSNVAKKPSELANQVLEILAKSKRFELFVSYGRAGKPYLFVWDDEAGYGREVAKAVDLKCLLMECAHVQFKRGYVTMAELITTLKNTQSINYAGGFASAESSVRHRRAKRHVTK